jgi:hypothetical protein
MKIYQVYYWHEYFGPKVSFYGTKKEALTFAKSTAREVDISGNVEVSRVRFPSKKEALLHYLNCVDATSLMPIDKEIASLEGIDDDEGGE